MKCPRPIEPIDLEALASGEPPVMAADAREHLSACAACSLRLDQWNSFSDLFPEEEVPAFSEGFAARIERLRAYSRRERISLRVWASPALLFGVLVSASAAILSVPILSGAEQAGVWAGLASAFGGELRALAAWPKVIWTALPASTEAMTEFVRTERGFAAMAILLALPFGFGTIRLLSPRGTR